MMFWAAHDLRSILTAIGTTLCVAAVFLAPLAASQPAFPYESARGGRERQPVPTLSFDRRRLLERITLRRDPFVEPPEIAARTQSERSPRSAGSRVVVEGIIDGKRPRALVQIGTTEQIVAVGDMLDGDTITEIESDGIRFSSGRLIRPASGGQR
ncbi:MAG: hypothetical protein ACP5O6_07275 [Candidatus Baltobacteraceae bacterium]